jgi:hypothetical protein
MVTGERTVTAKLQSSDIVAIRALLRRGHGLDFISSLFGVSKRMVARIRDGLSWDKVIDRDEIIKQASECPATLGCLLALVREAWQTPKAYVASRGEGLDLWVVCLPQPRADHFGHGANEADALVRALEAAP